MALNARQKKFVAFYVLYGSATKAAKLAGYSEKSAHVDGPRMLENARVREAIDHELSKITKRAALKKEKVLKDIHRLATYDIKEIYAPDGTLKHPSAWPDDLRRALSSVSTTDLYIGKGALRKKIGQAHDVKLTDRARYFEMLGKHFKLFTDVVETSGRNINVNVNLPANGSETGEPDEE